MGGGGGHGMDLGKPSVFSVASRPMKLALSFGIFYSSLALGIFMTALNPSVEDFVIKFDSDVDRVSLVFMILQACYVIGALSVGLLNALMSRQVVVIFLLTLSSTCLLIFPHIKSETVYFILGGAMGFGGGGFDASQVAWIIDIWRHEAGPFILSQHFLYSVGTLVSPVVFAPFLVGGREGHGGGGHDEVKLEGEHLTHNLMNETLGSFQNSTAVQGGSDLRIPFTIPGCLGLGAVIVHIVFLILFQKPKRDFERNKIVTKESQRRATLASIKGNSESDVAGSEGNAVMLADGTCVVTLPEKPKKQNICQRLLYDRTMQQRLFLIFLACFYIGFFQGMEQTTMEFLSTFAQYSEIALSQKDAARVLLGCNIGFAAGRGVGVILILKIPAEYILAGNFTLMFIGNTLLIALGVTSLPYMWAGSIALGIGFSTMYPAFYAYLEKYLFVSDQVASIVSVSGGVVSSIYPLIVGSFVEHYPKVLLYVVYVGIFVNLAAFLTLFWFTRRGSGEDGHKTQEEGEQDDGDSVKGH